MYTCYGLDVRSFVLRSVSEMRSRHTAEPPCNYQGRSIIQPHRRTKHRQRRSSYWSGLAVFRPTSSGFPATHNACIVHPRDVDIGARWIEINYIRFHLLPAPRLVCVGGGIQLPGNYVYIYTTGCEFALCIITIKDHFNYAGYDISSIFEVTHEVYNDVLEQCSLTQLVKECTAP